MSIRDVSRIKPLCRNWFIQTGTSVGTAIQMMLDLGVPHIRSVELSKSYHDGAVARFAKYPQVELILGASQEKLWSMIEDLDEQLFIFLDAHFSGEPEQASKGVDQNSIIMAELDAVAKHPRKDHIVVIDDTPLDWFILPDNFMRKRILEINPTYTFSQLDEAIVCLPGNV